MSEKTLRRLLGILFEVDHLIHRLIEALLEELDEVRRRK